MLKRHKPRRDLEQGCSGQREPHHAKGPTVEPNLVCSRNGTLLTTPREGQWQFRKVKTEVNVDTNPAPPTPLLAFKRSPELSA